MGIPQTLQTYLAKKDETLFKLKDTIFLILQIFLFIEIIFTIVGLFLIEKNYLILIISASLLILSLIGFVICKLIFDYLLDIKIIRNLLHELSEAMLEEKQSDS